MCYRNWFYLQYFQALYYWLRTYLLERRDVANKSELGRLALSQQRMQQNIPGSEGQVHQGPQSGGGIGSHESGSHGQEADRSSGPESSSMHVEQSMPQNSANVSDSSQGAMRRNTAMGLVASAASAFDAAKDIMEALRSKHSNLASELEVCGA